MDQSDGLGAVGITWQEGGGGPQAWQRGLVGLEEAFLHLCKGLCECLDLSHPVLDISKTYPLTHYCKPP